MFEELTDSVCYFIYIQWIMVLLFAVVSFKFNVIYISGFVSSVLVFAVLVYNVGLKTKTVFKSLT